MSDCNTITKVLLRGGTDQGSRYPGELNPDTLLLHGFGITEWMKFAYEFASHVNYFEGTNTSVPQGDWQDFFKGDDELESFLEELEESNQLTPHLTLFICFLKLLEETSDRFNQLTRRHLDFYYKEVLQIEKLPAQYDKVHLLFELSKNIQQEKLGTDTRFNGGKDANGKLRAYGLTDEFPANRASIKELKAFYFAPDTFAQNVGIVEESYLKAAEIINSSDGLGDDLDEDNPYWYAFGYHHEAETVDTDVFSELPDAKLGFSLSSPSLLLTEGDRHIQFTFSFETGAYLSTFNVQDLLDNITVDYTGEKKWIEAKKLSTSVTLDAIDDRAKIDPAQRTKVNFSTTVSAASKTVKLYINLEHGDKPSAAYDPEIHLSTYDTEDPVFKFMVDTSTLKGLRIYEAFSKKLTTATINVQVEEMADITVENDHGAQNPKKPIFPFTSIPVNGSSFTVSHDEMLGKNWQKVGVEIKWKNQPDNFYEWYIAFKKEYEKSIKPNWLLGYELIDLGVGSKQKVGVSLDTIVPYESQNTSGNSYFTGKVSLRTDNNWIKVSSQQAAQLFRNSLDSNTTIVNDRCVFHASKSSGVGDMQSLRISLNQSFMHELYPRLYALALTADDDGNTDIPNVPYTPFTEEVLMCYSATDTVSPNTSGTYDTATLKIFHEFPFGQSQEHIRLRRNFAPTGSDYSTLTPAFDRGGELYIGLENADNLQKVSLLIQVMEGSENPESSDFSANDGITWHILCKNYWKKLDSTLLLTNGIDNFLKSGLVTFKIPKEATQDNTVLDSGLIWVKARLDKSFDAVCKVLGIHAQAALAEFINNDNELSHLEKGLESGTISKLIERSSRVKTITQPYNSFGGKPEEDDDAYYLRVSERLRHKQRAVNLWDYERMVLQEFTDIYKVKCLNHSSCCSYVAPGHVMLVVIPDTVNKNVFDIYKPMVSTAHRNEIKEYMSQYTSLHVRLLVENPEYEELTVKVLVRFYDQYDESLYSQQLKNDITRLLSPWAFDEEEQVEFGVTLHKSVLVDYLEELYYVDYLDSVKMFLGATEIQTYEPSTPRSILVSSNEHVVEIASPACTSSQTNSVEECQ